MSQATTTIPEVAAEAKVKERVVEAERSPSSARQGPHLAVPGAARDARRHGCVMAFMTVWSIVVDAPLEEPANPTKTPNPSKAPWYFLGLQEILVYFDPWFAGVVLPGLIIVGLMVIPYIDVNPKGNGYYCFKERKFAISTFLFGFLVHVGRAHHHGHVHPRPGLVPLPPRAVLGCAQDGRHHQPATCRPSSASPASIPRWRSAGLLGLLPDSGIPAVYWKLRNKTSAILQQLGLVRYGITAFFFMTMTGHVREGRSSGSFSA